MRIAVSSKGTFAYRVAGIALSNNHVLLHKDDADNFWVLPGGSCDFYEESQTALQREISEEIGAEIKVGPLLWVVENFYSYREKPVHELGMYYLFEFTGPSRKLYDTPSFEGTEKHITTQEAFKLYFRWFPLDDLSRINIKPGFLGKKLRATERGFERIVHRDSLVAD